MNLVRVAVIGAGAFGKNHLRILKELPGAQLTAVADLDPARASDAAREYGCQAIPIEEVAHHADAAIVATPTTTHGEIGTRLLESGIDVLIEKPIASDHESAQRLIDTAGAYGRILQVGHLERFNPAVQALRKKITLPLFFEIHRMSVFSPRSLDVDVVLDLMIHDLDIVLAFTGLVPEEIRAAGIRILSQKVDIANVRLAFPGGCVANLTASRVSTEKVRKIRLFQPHQYISLDYQRQDAIAFNVLENQQIGIEPFQIQKGEPLKLELESFIDCVQNRSNPTVTGRDGANALGVALAILAKIEEHGAMVADTVRRSAATP